MLQYLAKIKRTYASPHSPCCARSARCAAGVPGQLQRHPYPTPLPCCARCTRCLLSAVCAAPAVLQEYLASSSAKEAEEALHELAVPHYLHEFVYK